MQLFVNILIFIGIFIYANYLKIKDLNIDKNKFEGEVFNLINIISYSFPLNKLFEENRKLNKKEEKYKKKIKELDLERIFDLRSFMTLKYILFLIPLFIILIAMFITKYYNKQISLLPNCFKYFLIPIILAYLPDIYFIKRTMNFEKFNFDEVVILQLFMVLLIKSNSTIEDVLYAFSRMDTYHKRTFEKAYRISLRNKSEALNYLEDKFQGTVFGNSFKVLNEMYMYSKEDSVRILVSNLKAIEKESMTNKNKKELKKFSYSQVSVIIPFSISVFLGVIPLIQYGINSITKALNGI